MRPVIIDCHSGSAPELVFMFVCRCHSSCEEYPTRSVFESTSVAGSVHKQIDGPETQTQTTDTDTDTDTNTDTDSHARPARDIRGGPAGPTGGEQSRKDSHICEDLVAAL